MPKLIRGRDRKNLKVLLENNPDAIADIVTAYQSGEDVSKTLDNWVGFGTSGVAIAEYLTTLEVKPKPKPKKRTSKKEAASK